MRRSRRSRRECRLGDALDIGAIAARALVDGSLPPGAYPVAGPRSLTGAECAAVWSHALGRTVPLDDDGGAFARGVAEALEGAKRDDLLETWRALRRFGVPTQDKDVAATHALLGRAPTRYEEYVERTAAGWGAAAREGAEVG